MSLLLWPLHPQLSAPTAGPPFPRAELPEFRELLSKVRAKVVPASCKHFGDREVTELVAAGGCASTKAVSGITVIIHFTPLFYNR